MIQINGSTILMWIGILSPMCGVIVWSFMRLLDGRKESLSMRYEITEISNKVKKLEYLEKFVNEHETEIKVLIEKTKKM